MNRTPKQNPTKQQLWTVSFGRVQHEYGQCNGKSHNWKTLKNSLMCVQADGECFSIEGFAIWPPEDLLFETCVSQRICESSVTQCFQD